MKTLNETERRNDALTSLRAAQNLEMENYAILSEKYIELKERIMRSQAKIDEYQRLIKAKINPRIF
jgi:molecular chaperone GrpE (heat shock protein)